MMLWVVLCFMLTAAVLVSARPFLVRPVPDNSGEEQDLEMFREQIRELDADVARGALTETEAAPTRREIELRLVAAAKGQKDTAMADGSERGRMTGLAIVSGWVVLGSVGLFALMQDPPPPPPRIVASAPTAPPQAPPQQQAAAQPLGTVEAMTARLAERLEANGNDPEGWQMLGWSYLRTGNFANAASAFEEALALKKDDAELHALYGEALTRQAGGRIDPAALAAFETSLAIAPRNPRAGFFKGMALDQSGDTAAAVALWLDILDRSPQNADWVPGLVDRIKERAAASGIDVSGHAKLAALSAPPELRGPSPDDVQAAMQMDAQDRSAMIRGMVEGLAARLGDDPNDAAGWARLIRSYGVLGDTDAARAALATAQSTFAPGVPGRQEIDEAGAFLAAQ